MYKFFIFSTFFLTSLIGYSQNIIAELTGTVTDQNTTISDILVVNLNSKKSIITDDKGAFTIEVKLQDTLQFSAINYQTKKILIVEEFLVSKKVQIDLDKKIVDLEEIVILPNNLTGQIDLDLDRINSDPINTFDYLRLPITNIKSKTKNERLLFEADDGKMIQFYGIAASVNVTKLMNTISGRTKKLKTHVLLDKHMEFENNVDKLFSKKVLSEELKIPLTKITNFLDFCINQPDFPELSEPINALQVFTYFKSKSFEYKNANKLN